MAVTHSVAARNAAANAVVDILDTGTGAAEGSLIIQTAGSAEVATLPLSNPAFGNASSGTATANAITSDTNATGGTAAKAALRDRDDVETILCSVTASGGGGDIIISNTSVGAGDTVSCSSLTYSAPA
jgi:hypothetical protein